MAGTVKAGSADIFSEINTTPLIDVMLVLLTLLIITLPLRTHAIKIDMPRPAPTQPPVAVTLEIDWDGTALWNGRAVDRATLGAYLVQAAHQNPQPEIHIQANRLAKYDAVARVLSDSARLGETHVSFIDIGSDSQ